MQRCFVLLLLVMLLTVMQISSTPEPLQLKTSETHPDTLDCFRLKQEMLTT